MTVIEPIRLAFDLDCPAERAFDIWTARISTWWRADHTASGELGLTVILEPRVGRRLFERMRDGIEHDWGLGTRLASAAAPRRQLAPPP